MKTLHRSLPTLQRSFRKKFREKQETEVQEKMMRLQATETKIEKQRRIRQTHEKMLQSMEIVPAGTNLLVIIVATRLKIVCTITFYW